MGAQPRHQSGHHRVGEGERIGQSWRPRSEGVSGVVDRGGVERQQAGSPRRRDVEPGQQRIDPIGLRHPTIEGQPVRRVHAADRGLGPGPEHRTGRSTRLLQRDPHRLAAPPPRLLHGGAVAHREAAEDAVADVVGDDAVVVRAQPRDDRVVVREGLARERGLHPLGAHADPGERVEGRRDPAPEVVGSEPIDRDEDDDRRVGRPRPRGGRATGRTRSGQQQEGKEAAHHWRMRRPGVLRQSRGRIVA